MFQKLFKKYRGFTLIELLVVITIIGILSGIVIVAVGGAIDTARIAGSQRFSHSIRMRIGMDMVGSWPFENNTVDHSGWNNHGTLVTGTAPCVGGAWVSGVTGQSLCLDGVDDRVDVPHTEIQNTVFGTSRVFTLEAWAFPRVWVSHTAIINKARGACHGHITNGIWADTSGFSCVMGSGVEPALCNPAGSIIMIHYSPPLNQWHHITCTADGTNLIMFVNGREVRRRAIAGLTHPRSSNTVPLTLGRRTVEHGPSFNGNIDEVRIFRAAVPASYIQKKYVQGIKSLASSEGITQEEKEKRISQLRNSEQLVIDLDAALADPIDFSPYAHYFENLTLEVTE